jgi:hypothetical protein
VFVELPPFERYRAEYLDDSAFSSLQAALMTDPEAGDVIQGTGVCERCASRIRGEGRASAVGSGSSIDWWKAGLQFWLFTLYGKDEIDDVSAAQRKALKALLEQEVVLRRRQ